MKTPKLSDILTAKDSSEITLDDLRQQVGTLANEDKRFLSEGDADAHISSRPWTDNIIFDDGEWFAVIVSTDGKLFKVGFTVEDGAVTELHDDAKEVKRKTDYVAASEPFKFNGVKVTDADGGIIKAVGIPTGKAAQSNEDLALVICKDAGLPLAEKKWEFGKPIEFMWAPGGKTVITAGCAGRSLRLWVIGDQKGAKDVQSSFAKAVAESPRRVPFGCIEHEEKERAFEPKKFLWKEDPEPGIYCSAVPTKLGETNVNGKLQTSFSPCFRHDARFTTAVCTECDKGAMECDCGGVLHFPEGVRGSESNPAHIVGVFEKSVGSLTNWPAFKDILPVTAKEPNPPAPTITKAAEGEGKKTKHADKAKEAATAAYHALSEAEINPTNSKEHAEAAAEHAEAATGHAADAKDHEKHLAHHWAGKAHEHARDAHSRAGNWQKESHHSAQAQLHRRYATAAKDDKHPEHSRAMLFKAGEPDEADARHHLREARETAA